MGFRVVERTCSKNEDAPTVLLANLHITLDIEWNLEKMLQVVDLACKRDVNIVIFPELCVTGYVWDAASKSEVFSHLKRGEGSKVSRWIETLCDRIHDPKNQLEYIFYNNVRRVGSDYFNSTFILNTHVDPYDDRFIYDKVFLPPIEQPYFKDDPGSRLVLETQWGRFGFLICYDLNFVELAHQYAFTDHVDAIITMASWRSQAVREYSQMNVRADHYYGFLWDLMNSSKAAYNQIWSLGVNTVGRHDKSKAHFWGGSGVWAPSGLCLLRASNINEELLIARNLDIKGKQRELALVREPLPFFFTTILLFH